MRSIKSMLLRGVCSIGIAVIGMGKSQAAGSLLPEFVCSSMRRIVAHRMISPNSMILQCRS